MTGATMCSGIGAPECAMPEIKWLWSADIEPFPNAVRAYRWPDVPNLGDITADDFAERALAIGRPDVLVAGTPCQAFSVAGLRRSLDDHRGNLTLRFVELVDAIQPRFVLWENVPGVLNTDDNAFGCFLGALSGAGSALVPARGQRWTDAGLVDGPTRRIAWRVQDAQYHGLAQRRERVFVVASPRDGADPYQVLFEPEGVQRHTPPRREAGQAVTSSTRSGIANSLGAHGGSGYRQDLDNETYVAETSLCLNAKGGSGRLDPTFETFVSHALRADGFDASEDGTGRGTPIVPVDLATTPTLTSNGDAHSGFKDEAGLVPVACEISDTLSVGANRTTGFKTDIAAHGMAVRRLTPTECERLQGFPDGWTLIEYRGKTAADGPRYKALGNSMAVPVIRWILTRIMAAAGEETVESTSKSWDNKEVRDAACANTPAALSISSLSRRLDA